MHKMVHLLFPLAIPIGVGSFHDWRAHTRRRQCVVTSGMSRLSKPGVAQRTWIRRSHQVWKPSVASSRIRARKRRHRQFDGASTQSGRFTGYYHSVLFHKILLSRERSNAKRVAVYLLQDSQSNAQEQQAGPYSSLLHG